MKEPRCGRGWKRGWPHVENSRWRQARPPWLCFLADASLRGVYVRALRRAFPDLDLLTATEAGLREASDPVILERAAGEGRIVLSQDYATMGDFALMRVAAGQSMPGLLQVPTHAAVAVVLDDSRLILAASLPEDWQDRVVYLPLRP